MLRPLISRVLQAVTFCLMQSDRDATRIRALGVVPQRVMTTGNLKFDQPLPATVGGVETWIKNHVLPAGRELIVAGSTHPGEEDQLLCCYDRLRKQFPSLMLLLAPRHIERVSQLQAAVKAKGFSVALRSDLESSDRRTGNGAPEVPSDVVILDTRGELAAVYRYAVVAFVGGTFIPVGGHNLLEPALWGKPVLFGPYTDHCAEVARLLLEAGGGRRVADSGELTVAIADLLNDRSALDRMGSAARSVVLENRGALERTLDVIARVLDQARRGMGSSDADQRLRETHRAADTLAH